MYNTAVKDNRFYHIVVNHEQQYSLWFVDQELPLGWNIVQIPETWQEQYKKNLPFNEYGNKTMCLAYIKEIWLDLRPLSLQISQR